MKKGYYIIEKNFRSLSGEIDIIAFDPISRTIIFVEVKLRKENSQVSPEESITPAKIKKIKRTAIEFLQKKQIKYNAIRFDFIGITTENGKEIINHIENAF
ncbi:YraN family protein [Desulfurobacterium atlanticum]|uniref:Putative endonuclease n=1 Tax=Desulfurobacterium atlanticum TaxID=240169 RepID=A0A239A1I3_9BACT|nr:YraN family protein [Desulfurobacterium atlanticum]SNR88763.1 putative endonuclease [Desulfurobacterium atlanticum]